MTITKKVGEEEERHTAEEEEEDEEDEGMLSTEDEDGCICPGSPSFRVYYLDSISNNLADNKDDGELLLSYLPLILICVILSHN